VSSARTGSRDALFDLGQGRVETPVYDMGLLRPGHRLQGPALVESEDTTVVVAPDWTLEVDGQGALLLTRAGEEQSDV